MEFLVPNLHTFREYRHSEAKLDSRCLIIHHIVCKISHSNQEHILMQGAHSEGHLLDRYVLRSFYICLREHTCPNESYPEKWPECWRVKVVVI